MAGTLRVLRGRRIADRTPAFEPAAHIGIAEPARPPHRALFADHPDQHLADERLQRRALPSGEHRERRRELAGPRPATRVRRADLDVPVSTTNVVRGAVSPFAARTRARPTDRPGAPRPTARVRGRGRTMSIEGGTWKKCNADSAPAPLASNSVAASAIAPAHPIDERGATARRAGCCPDRTPRPWPSKVVVEVVSCRSDPSGPRTRRSRSGPRAHRLRRRRASPRGFLAVERAGRLQHDRAGSITDRPVELVQPDEAGRAVGSVDMSHPTVPSPVMSPTNACCTLACDSLLPSNSSTVRSRPSPCSRNVPSARVVTTDLLIRRHVIVSHIYPNHTPP